MSGASAEYQLKRLRGHYPDATITHRVVNVDDGPGFSYYKVDIDPDGNACTTRNLSDRVSLDVYVTAAIDASFVHGEKVTP